MQLQLLTGECKAGMLNTVRKLRHDAFLNTDFLHSFAVVADQELRDFMGMVARDVSAGDETIGCFQLVHQLFMNQKMHDPVHRHDGQRFVKLPLVLFGDFIR